MIQRGVISAILVAILSGEVWADSSYLQQEIHQLQQKTQALQHELDMLKQQKTLGFASRPKATANSSAAPSVQSKVFHQSAITAHTIDQPEALGFYPTALVADEHILTYIAGTPVVTSPYTGDRPSFDGSDYIVNISSINRDIRLMQQRRRLYRAYQAIGYPAPNIPIIAISGKSEPVASFSNPYFNQYATDFTLGSSELDVAAILNRNVEAFISVAYDASPPATGGPRVSNSSFNLNLGFVNIGNLDKTPFYFTAGQLYAPFGRYSSSMITSPMTLVLARVKTRPFILGYKSQQDNGPYAAIYGFRSEITTNRSTIGGVNVGYTFGNRTFSGDIGMGVIGSLNDSQGMQSTGAIPFTTFGGFSSITNGSEQVKKIPGLDIHVNLNIDRYNFAAEWVGASQTFRPQDLSFNGHGAKPQAAQLEAGMTFKAFHKPASLALGYQWSKQTLALHLPEQRISTVFNISVWKDTVESLEYRHDMDFKSGNFANGAAPSGMQNLNTLGTGKSADTLIAQIGVFF